jgi:pyridoxamine 5'-phosphate oxidase
METALKKFSEWFDLAKAEPAIKDATAMTLATATKDGFPSARVVLLKGFSAQGFAFYTNMNSRKSRELQENPRAALCFYWMPLDLQVRIEGVVAAVTTEEADDYFASRSRDRQIGAWASHQSEPLASRELLQSRVREYELKFKERLMPAMIEFWHQQEGRLHERERYERTANGSWAHTLINP